MALPCVPHPLSQCSLLKEDTSQPVAKEKKNEHMLLRNKSTHQYFHTSPPTPAVGPFAQARDAA
jgi:hypothetical protein